MSVFLPFSSRPLAVQCDIGAAKSRKRRLTRRDQNTFCKSDPNVDGVADVRIDR